MTTTALGKRTHLCSGGRVQQDQHPPVGHDAAVQPGLLVGGQQPAVQLAWFRSRVGAELIDQASVEVLVVRNGVSLPAVAVQARMSCRQRVRPMDARPPVPVAMPASRRAARTSCLLCRSPWCVSFVAGRRIW